MPFLVGISFFLSFERVGAGCVCLCSSERERILVVSATLLACFASCWFDDTVADSRVFLSQPLYTPPAPSPAPSSRTRAHTLTLVFVSPSTTPIVSSAWMLTHPWRFMVGATRVYGNVYHFQAAINLRLYLNPAFREKRKSSLVEGRWASVRRSNFENFCLRCSILFLMLYTSVYLFVFCRFPLIFAAFFFSSL